MVKDNERIIRGGLTIRVPIEELNISIREKIEEHIRKNSKFAFTRVGLMVEIFEYNPKDLNKPFKEWPRGATTQYNKISTALNELVDMGIIGQKKKGKMYLYWLIEGI